VEYSETTIPAYAQSVEEFCESHSISRSLFYKLHRDGKAPRIMKIGRRTLISNEAAIEWRKSMEVDASGYIPKSSTPSF
jgi:predicted DNA-binding transcriptional regulator AlpA